MQLHVEPSDCTPYIRSGKDLSSTGGLYKVLYNGSSWKSYDETHLETFNHQNKFEKDEQNVEHRCLCSSLAERQLLVATELRNLDNFALKSAMMEKIEKTLPVVVYLRFLHADTGLKEAFIHFFEVVLTKMSQNGWIDQLIYYSLERWKSDIPENKLAEVVCKHPNLEERVLEKSRFSESKEHFVEHGNVVDPEM